MFDAVAKAPEIESLPFPYKQNAFCRYEPIEKRIPHAKVLIVNKEIRPNRITMIIVKEELGY